VVPCVKGLIWGGGRPNSRRGSNASGWWKMMCWVREGIRSGLGSWFDDNTRRVVGNGRNTFFWIDNWLDRAPLRLQFNRLYELLVQKECLVEDMSRMGWGEEGYGWMWRRRLLTWEEESVRECSALLHNVILQENI